MSHICNRHYIKSVCVSFEMSVCVCIDSLTLLLGRFQMNVYFLLTSSIFSLLKCVVCFFHKIFLFYFSDLSRYLSASKFSSIKNVNVSKIHCLWRVFPFNIKFMCVLKPIPIFFLLRLLLNKVVHIRRFH